MSVGAVNDANGDEKHDTDRNEFPWSDGPRFPSQEHARSRQQPAGDKASCHFKTPQPRSRACSRLASCTRCRRTRRHRRGIPFPGPLFSCPLPGGSPSLLSVPYSARAPPPSTRTAPRPVSRSRVRHRSIRPDASTSDALLHELPLRSARRKTHCLLKRLPGT